MSRPPSKKALDHDIDPLQVSTMQIWSHWSTSISSSWFKSSGMWLYMAEIYLSRAALGLPNKFLHLTKTEEVVITRLQIGYTKATKSHILLRGSPTTCHHCSQILTIDHMLLECAVLQESPDKYHTADSLSTCTLFKTIPETCIVEFLWEAGFFCLIWTGRHSIQFLTWIIPELMQFFNFQLALRQGQYSLAWLICQEIEGSYERHLLM